MPEISDTRHEPILVAASLPLRENDVSSDPSGRYRTSANASWKLRVSALPPTMMRPFGWIATASEKTPRATRVRTIPLPENEESRVPSRLNRETATMPLPVLSRPPPDNDLAVGLNCNGVRRLRQVGDAVSCERAIERAARWGRGGARELKGYQAGNHRSDRKPLPHGGLRVGVGTGR